MPKSQIIAHLTGEGLKPGAISKLFEEGVRAVSISEDSRINELWNRVVHNVPPEPSGSSGWKEFWNNSIFTFVRNHFKHKTDYGDLFWFENEKYGYIARKIVTYPDLQTKQMRVWPEKIYNDNDELAVLSQDTLKLAWDVAMDVLSSAWTHGKPDPSQFVVHIELLKYANSYNELERMFDFINVGSLWKRIGMKLDLGCTRARGPFAKKHIKIVYAFCSLVPYFGKWVRKLNDHFANNPFDAVDSNFVPVGQAHVDGSRFLTILASDRDAMKTEAFGDGRWEEMPMSTENFVIFPGDFYDSTNKVKPTIHRYCVQKVGTEPKVKKLNLTFVLGISTKKMFDERKPALHS